MKDKKVEMLDKQKATWNLILIFFWMEIIGTSYFKIVNKLKINVILTHISDTSFLFDFS